jgi:hypothetical protein
MSANQKKSIGRAGDATTTSSASSVSDVPQGALR